LDEEDTELLDFFATYVRTVSASLSSEG
jgi:hypothetical protein